MADDEVMVAEKFPQDHEELVFQETWWWAVHICLCVIAVLANLIFIITVIYNRYVNARWRLMHSLTITTDYCRLLYDKL